MKRLGIIILVIILALVLYFLLSSNGKKNGREISASGTIEVTEVEVSSKLPGRIEKLLVNEGDSVVKGQVLIELEKNELEAQLKQAQAAYQASLAQLAQAKSNSENLKTNLDRTRELFRAGSSTQQQLDDQQTKYQMANDQFSSAAHLVDQNKAMIDLINVNLDNSIIKSPINALILSKNTEIGEVVSPGSSLLTLGDMLHPWVKIYIKETDLGKVKLGQKAQIKIDTYPDKVFEGRVTYISGQAEFTPKNIQTKEERVKLVFGIKVSLENPEQIFKPGMPADVILSTD
ncbi:MAG TPA: efflux RND transporter periplasmic adaptor subunit [Terriglobales bacterium]|nr:efflux RND transporter periplasmic adaptor subunit [Terriglobales bacterium]